MASSPQFTNLPTIDVAQVSAANTNRDGTGTIVTISSGSTNGRRINKVTVRATGTTTAGVVRLFIHDGSNARLLKEILVTAITPSTTIETFTSTIEYSSGLILPTGYSLRASTNNAETFNIIAEGGDI